MRPVKFFVAVALCITATLAQAAGFRFIEVPADAEGPAMKGAMWTPCTAPPGEIDLGDIILPGVKDCPISGDKLPLVVISHGNHDDMLRNHDTAETLADSGFIVAAINHPGDSSADLSRVADLSVMVERPTDIKRLIDFMLGASPAASRIDPQRIGFFGFSAGGYTGPVVRRAHPAWARRFCHWSAAASVCEQILRKEFQAQPLVHDARIKAAVIADPACCFFGADSFAAVKVPVQLWASERGLSRGLHLAGLTPESVAAIGRSLTAEHEYHVVPNAGHFAFWPPCPPALATGFPEGCTDAAGFDRTA